MAAAIAAQQAQVSAVNNGNNSNPVVLPQVSETTAKVEKQVAKEQAYFQGWRALSGGSAVGLGATVLIVGGAEVTPVGWIATACALIVGIFLALFGAYKAGQHANQAENLNHQEFIRLNQEVVQAGNRNQVPQVRP